MNSTRTEKLLRGITNKDQKDLIRGALAEGWTIAPGPGQHVILRHVSGAVVRAGTTMSPYSVRVLRARLRRALRAATGRAA